MHVKYCQTVQLSGHTIYSKCRQITDSNKLVTLRGAITCVSRRGCWLFIANYKCSLTIIVKMEGATHDH